METYNLESFGSGQKGRNQKTGKKKNRVEQEEEEREMRRSQQREGGTKKVGRLEKQWHESLDPSDSEIKPIFKPLCISSFNQQMWAA